MDQALDGVRILDLTDGVAGSYCTKLLAGFGAEVIKVEHPGFGDSVRRQPPFKDDLPDTETALSHLHLSMGKKSVTLDIDTAPGRDLLGRLIAQSDVVIEGLSAAEAASRGLDFASLSGAKPDLIVASITWYGKTGPSAGNQATELTAFAAGGYAYLTGLPDREPLKAGGPQAEQQGGLHAAAAILAALLNRETTGEGDYLDVSIVEAICYAHAGMSAYLNQGVVFQRRGARLLSDAPRAMYPSTILPCKDKGFVHVHYAPADPALLGVLTESDRLSDPELWETPRAFADEIDEILSEWLSHYDKHEAVARAQELRHPWAEVLDASDLLEDEQFRARGFFVNLDHPVIGPFEHLGAPVDLSGTPWQTRRAPLLGEHNEEIFCQRLGLSSKSVADLRAAGVV